MYIKERVSQYVLKATDTKCDVCGLLGGMVDPVGWHNFSSRHDGCGNDSIDSIESHDVCSVRCFAKMLALRIPDLDGNYGAEISDMDLAFAKELLLVLNAGLGNGK